MNDKKQPWQVERIIEDTVCLQCDLVCGPSTGERIAAAFVLNRMELLPDGYTDVIEAWDRLDGWQFYVRLIKNDYMHIIEERVGGLPF